MDPARGICLAEPNVTFEQLVTTTLKYNLVPGFVSRFPQTTIGEAFSTTSMESSSFKHGLFHHSVHSIEIVLQSGEVKRASSRENPDLFKGMINTRSTLAILTLLEIKLRPTAPFIELSYLPITSAREALTLLNSVVHDEPFDYIDGILFAPNRGVIMVGRSTANRNVYPVRRLLRPSDPFFHKHAESCLAKSMKSSENHTELIPLPEYLFRYSSSVFWLGGLTIDLSSASAATSPSATSPTLSLFSRASLVDPTTRTRRAHALLATGGLAQRLFCADLAVPIASAENLLTHIHNELTIYPLWLCPSRDDSSAPFHAWRRTNSWPLQTRQMLLNVGLYGAAGPKTRVGIINNNSGREYTTAFLAANCELETTVHELGGVKSWTAPVFQTEDEFWAGLEGVEGGGREGYTRLRGRCGAEGLEGLWEGVKLVEGKRKAQQRPSMTVGGGSSGRDSSMSARSSISLLRSASLLAPREVSPSGPTMMVGGDNNANGRSVGVPVGKHVRQGSLRNFVRRTVG